MKISVIIPAYNAEKYLGVCLESILIQTFTDFEVIVVDDCSTDASLAVAESYLERFDGRLKIICLEENTGSGAIPRNVGLEYARGKYVFFMDADDLIIDTALETLYNFAEEYQADALYMEQGFQCGAEIVPQNLTEVFWNPPKFISDVPKFEVEDVAERIEMFSKRAIAVTTWTKFSRRDFLVGNNIKFPDMKPSQDVIWTIKWLCSAKKILRVSTPLYVYRVHNDSVTGKKRSPEEALTFWFKPLVTGVKFLCEFMDGKEFFKQNPAVRLKLLNFFASIPLDYMNEALKKLSATQVYEIFLREFSRIDSLQPALSSYLLLMINLYRNELRK